MESITLNLTRPRYRAIRWCLQRSISDEQFRLSSDVPSEPDHKLLRLLSETLHEVLEAGRVRINWADEAQPKDR